MEWSTSRGVRGYRVLSSSCRFFEFVTFVSADVPRLYTRYSSPNVWRFEFPHFCNCYIWTHKAKNLKGSQLQKAASTRFKALAEVGDEALHEEIRTMRAKVLRRKQTCSSSSSSSSSPSSVSQSTSSSPSSESMQVNN